MTFLLQNGTVVTAGGSRRADVRCRDGRIVEVGPDLPPATAEERIDASGAFVLPGGVDPHVHLALPVAGTVSADDWTSGTAAALAGGTTTVVDFVHPEHGESWLAALAARKAEAAAGAVADFGLHVAATWWGEGTRDEMARLVRDEGVPSFKVYLAYKATVGIDDGDLVRVLAAAAELGGTVLVHAEHGEAVEHLRDRLAAAGDLAPAAHARSRPPQLEGEAAHRAATLAGTLDARLYVVHVTCREATAAVAAARAAGADVHGETCPHYLLLDESELAHPDFAHAAAHVCAPPLRPKEHQAALWAALADGTLEVVATDHCPFTAAQKAAGRGDFRRIPGGLPGVEHRLALLWTHAVRTGRIDPARFVDLVATRPAKLFGLYPRKGAIEPGADADLVVWDPTATATLSAATHRHRTDQSVYEGFRVTGQPAVVIAAGQVRYRLGELQVETGAGRFLRRAGGNS